MTNRLKRQLEQLPTDPGIYKYFNAGNEIIYVGKAVNLKNRVRSYFIDKDIAPRTKILVSQIDHLEYIVVQSEMDALILEANLIKEHRPRFNIILKDDKSHLYIKITLYEDWPRISTCRATDINIDPKATYFGPFPSGRIVKETLRSLRRVFPYVAHNQPPVVGRRRPPQSYFYYNIPLTNQQTEPDLKEYRKQIFQIVHFLEGKRVTVIKELEKSMHAAARLLNYEHAGNIKKQLEGIAYITQKTISPQTYVSNPDVIADKRQQGLRELSNIITEHWSQLQTTLDDSGKHGNTHDNDQIATMHRIECFDISNISGQYAVGSMVVFINGEASKSDYRKFKIKREQAPNDVAMMAEVIGRRTKRLRSALNKSDQKQDKSFNAIPDLIMVDGGKGQLAAANQILVDGGLNIPVVGMTKREEELVLPSRSQSINPASNKAVTDAMHSATGSAPSVGKPKRSSAHGSIARNQKDLEDRITIAANYMTIRLARGSEALFLIQRIRDEAHRFAITYHRKLRAKGFIGDT